MKKLSTCILVGASLSANAAVALDPEIYGKANVSFQSSDDGEGSYTDIKSNASRFGIKGSEELQNGLEAVYLVEFQVDLSDESGDVHIKARNQYVGLRGGFGEVLLGRNDTRFKASQGKIDLFSDYKSDIKVLWKGENRMGNSLTYNSPSFGGVKAGLTYITEDETRDEEDPSAAEHGISASLVYGDAKLKKSMLYVALAGDQEVKGYDAVRLSSAVKLGSFKLGAMYQQQQAVESDSEQDGFLLSGAYKLNDMTFKLQHQTLEDAAFSTAGLDYKLADSTKVFTWYATGSVDDNAEGAPIVDGSAYFAVGLEHKF